MKDKNKEQLLGEIGKLKENIAELEKSESGRKKAEEERNRILKLSYDLICIAGMDGYFKYVNPAWERTLGYTNEELLSKPFLDFIHPEDHNINDAEVEKLSKGKQTIGFENRYIHKDGSIRTISWSATPFEKEKQLYCIGRDITDRMQAEEQLQNSEKQYRTLFETAPNGICQLNQEGIILITNVAFQQLLGYTDEELIGTSITKFIDPDHMEDHAKALKLLAESGKFYSESAVVNKNGAQIPVEIKGSMSMYQGQITMLGIVTDITDRKQAEEQIRERMKELQAFYSLSQITEREGITLDKLYREFVNILPKSWQHTEIACARIVINDSEFRSKNFSESKWMQSAPLKVNSAVVGKIEVCYLKEKPEQDEGPFLKEERQLIDAITERLGHITERKQAEEKIKATNQQLVASEQQLKAANQQLVASEQQLKASNQQLEASNQQLHASEQDLALRIKLAEIFLTAEDDEMMFTNILELILPELQSKFGVFGYIDDNGALVVPSMTRHIWDKCGIPDKRIVFPREKWGCSSWPRAINEGKANYSNEVSTITPKGHVAIERHISFPIMYQGNPIGLFQVANRDTDYGDADLAVLGRIADIVAPILAAKLQRDRQEKERKQAEEKIKATNQQLVASEQQLKAANQQLEASNQQLRASEQTIRKSEQELTIRNKIANIFLTIPDEDMYEEVLPVVLETLESKFGVFGYIDEEGAFVCPSMTKDIWDKCKVPGKNIIFPRETWGDSIWARAIREKNTLHSNKPFTVPKGHIPVRRALMVPIIHQSETIGLFEVANKETDYNDEDIRLLETIADYIAPVLNARLQRDWKEREREQAEEKIKATNQQLVASEQQLKANNQQLRAAEEELTKHRDHLQEMVDEQTTALKESEKYYRSIVQTALDGFWITDMKGRLVDVNDSYCKMIGYSREELLGGMSIRDLEAVENPEETEKNIKHILDHGYDRFESRHRRKDGKIIDLEIAATYSAESGGRLIVFLSDITERKQAEQELKQRTEQIETANKELESFSYSVSHDLRAPLRGIDGFSKRLLTKYADEFDEEGKHYLERIRAGCLRLGRLIEDMLKLSRITRTEMKSEDVDLSTMAHRIALGLQESNPKREVEFIIGDGLKTKGDTHLLYQVLENLLGNAWKYTSINAGARIEFNAVEHNGKQAFFVRDNGVGFEMKYVGKLFGVFQRLHTESEFPGTGIGLATVQRIIFRHGGVVWAEGEVGKGATFYFAL